MKSYTLLDGRKLSYSEYGKKNGKTVFYFHGFPGSSLEVEMFDGDKIARELDIKLIAPNRPGYGDSDLHLKTSLVSWPDDVLELADSQGIEKFSVLGYSGGGPSSISCANQIPERLHKVCIVSGMGPLDSPKAKDIPAWQLMRGPGFLQNIIMKGMKKMIDGNPEKFISNMMRSMPEVDRKELNNKKVQERFLRSVKEALKNGIKGAKLEAANLKNDWGFKLEKTNHPIQFWHGEEDLNVHIETARYLSETLPHAELNVFPGEGHLSLIRNKIKEILVSAY